ncbi:MAG: PEP-CTERM sorting domain-containing protein [Phycisphaerales bacterium]|nr:PEP-CTERM sorting domain-containing protein [Phycisphaerales bacterium]
MKTIITTTICAALATPAMAGYTIDLGSTPAPTYGTTLTFDEAGGPVGSGIPTDAWSASHGISSMQAGDGNNVVGNFSTTPGYGWLPDNNVFVGNFGIFMNFENDLTEFSAQVWDNGGPADFIAGGMILVLRNDGADVANLFVDPPAFGGVGDSWYNITTDGGSVFDEVLFVGFAFVSPQTIMGEASWNAVPAPGALALLGLGGLAATRRRRA